MDRNYDKHLELLGKTGKCLGCIRTPALPLDAEQCPPDMLHLKKGIISKLLNQVVDGLCYNIERNFRNEKTQNPFRVRHFQHFHVIMTNEHRM